MRIYSRNSGTPRALASVLLATFLMSTCPGLGWVQAFAAPHDDLATAQDLFVFGELGQAEAVLTAQIDSDQLQGDMLRDFLELRARCLLGLGQPTAAQDDFCRVHLLDNQWSPDPVNYTQSELQVYEATLADCQEVKIEPAVIEEEGGSSFFAKPVVWLVAGVGVAAAVLLGGGGGDDPVEVEDSALDEFPDPPKN